MKSFLQRSLDQLRTYQLVATVGELSQFGPLGRIKTRRQLGRSAELLPPQTALGTRRNEQIETLVDTGADNDSELSIGDSLAQQCVITCTVRYPNSETRDPATRICNVIGTLSWGGDGHSGEVDFDFRNGMVLRPVAGAFRLSARLAVDALDNQPNVPVTVGAWIGYGGPISPWGCTLTDRLAAVPGFLRVPPFATYLAVYGADSGVTVTWYAGPNPVGSVDLPSGSAGVKLPVPGAGVSRVQIAGEVESALAVWSLAL